MPYRDFPKSVLAKNGVLEQATQKVANTAPGQMAISADTIATLETTYPVFRQEIAERQEQLARQAMATKAENEQQGVLYNYVSHFMQVLNLGILRGKFANTDRLYYGLNANQSDLPKLRSEHDLVSWAKNLVAGEAKRLSENEGEKKAKPMSNPSIGEVENELNKFIALSNAQDEEKQAFDAENKDVLDMLPAIDDLIRDIYDEVEFYYRKETAANRRKMARQWGILYVSRNGELASREEED
jgi:hypothetical protein